MNSDITRLTANFDRYFSLGFEELEGLPAKVGRKVFVSKCAKGRFSEIFKKRNANFQYLHFFNQIASLKNLGFLSSQFSLVAPIKRRLPLQGGEIVYLVWHGKVYITQVNFFKDYNAAKMNIPAGAYVVRKSDDWAIEHVSETVNQVGYLRTSNLAINGYCSSANEAARYMPNFIEHGFGKESLKDVYTLFYNPSTGLIGAEWRSLKDGLGFTSNVAKKLADTLTLSAQKNMDKGVNLTVHENGHSLLKAALKIAHQRGDKLERFTVFYANPINNMEIVDKWRKRTGMKLAAKAPLLNTLSARQYLVSGNFISQPVVACRADPENRVASLYNSGLSALGMAGAVSVGTDLIGAAGWAFAIAPMLLGQSRALNQKVIDNRGKALQEGAKHLTQQTKKVVWDPVHKMLVRE